ncbi:MAG: hypothetical protein ACLSB9_05335 [Hydrogeniiclostridium mannosilyticum]
MAKIEEIDQNFEAQVETHDDVIFIPAYKSPFRFMGCFCRKARAPLLRIPARVAEGINQTLPL